MSERAGPRDALKADSDTSPGGDRAGLPGRPAVWWMRPRVVSFAASAAVFYGAVLIFFLWPWPQAPASLGIKNNDLLLHTWSMAWVVHQMGIDPTRVFEANMFWPHPGALSFTETLFPQSAMAAPVLWLGGGPLLAHNLVLFVSIVLAGVAAALLAFRLTNLRSAALIAGFGYAFAPFRFQHLVQIGVASYQWLPFVVLAFWEAASIRRAHAGLFLLAVASVLQALSSGYYAVLLAFVAGTALCFLGPRLWRTGRLSGVIVSLFIAAMVALSMGLPSVQLRGRQAVSRGTEEPIHWSAVPRSYLDPGSNVRALGLKQLVERTAEPLFPGIAISLLLLCGLWHSGNPAARKLSLVFGGACGLMSLGPVLRDLPFDLPGPFEIARHIPPIDMIRAPSRFGIGTILAVDVIAALGFASLIRRVPSRSRAPIAASVLAFMAVEMRPSIAHAIVLIAPPPSYTQLLATLDRGPLLELPWRTEEDVGFQLYWSTAHWQPMIAGYGGFPAEGNFPLAVIAQNFPTGFAARALRCAGVRYVVVHTGDVSEPQAKRAFELELPGVRRLGRFGTDQLFELAPWAVDVVCPPELPKVFRR